jgi:hypothetical protein
VPARGGDGCLMLNDPPRATRLVLLRAALLTLAVLTSVAAAAVLGFAAYLFAQGYADGGRQQGAAPLAFPLSFLIAVVVGLPLTLTCALSWAGYVATSRRHRRLLGSE